MPAPRASSSGYGVLLLIGLLVGFAAGIAVGEPSAGTVIGLGLGGLVALALRLKAGD